MNSAVGACSENVSLLSLPSFLRLFLPTFLVGQDGGEAYVALHEILAKNAWGCCIKAGPSMAFHNHNAAEMTALYCMGASAACERARTT